MRTAIEAKDSIVTTQAALRRLEVHLGELRMSIANDRMDSALWDSIKSIRDADSFLAEAIGYANSVIAKQQSQCEYERRIQERTANHG